MTLTARWAQVSALLLALGGLGMSAYLTITHYATSVPLACPDTGVINCAKVTSSPESVLFGVPVAVLGLAFYMAMTAACTPRAWRARWRGVAAIRLSMLVTGIGFVIYLIYTELFTLDAICLLCTVVHVITFGLFALVLLTAPGQPQEVPGQPQGAQP